MGVGGALELVVEAGGVREAEEVGRAGEMLLGSGPFGLGALLRCLLTGLEVSVSIESLGVCTVSASIGSLGVSTRALSLLLGLELEGSGVSMSIGSLGVCALILSSLLELEVRGPGELLMSIWSSGLWA
jgi:hypothetical protein